MRNMRKKSNIIKSYEIEYDELFKALNYAFKHVQFLLLTAVQYSCMG